MIFTESRLAGAYVIDPEPVRDQRGSFTRTFCAKEFVRHGLDPAVAQCSVSGNVRAGTVRGMHFQLAPHAECKLVRCARGTIFDVIIDLRPTSPTYRSWLGVELSQANGRMIYVPAGFAHGFQTLVDASEVVYQMSAPYAPGSYRGVRHDDPAFAIRWPQPVTVISEADRSHPDWTG